MRLSRKSDYALRALLALASQEDQHAPLPVREISERHDIPRKFLEAIMSELRHLGFIESIAGKKGGYRLAVPPASIPLGAVLKHFDGHLESLDSEANGVHEEAASDCVDRVNWVLREIGGELDRLMEEVTLEMVLRGESLHRVSVDDQEFMHGHGI
jgi:Rrf2 family protein